jgi:16S rRNA (uracil1498-N3)-methyltransferase
MNRRFYCPKIPDIGDYVQLSPEESRHLVTVLRARQHETIELLDGQGVIARVTITEIGAARKSAGIRCRIDNKRECTLPNPVIHLFLSPPRARLMGQIIRQCVELGVAALTPVISQRSVAKPPADSLAHWQLEVREACKQSGNPFFLRIHEPHDFNSALSKTTMPGYMGWVDDDKTLDNGHDTMTDKKTCGFTPHQYDNPGDMRRPDDQTGNRDQFSLWIGPEGGYSPAESERLLASGMRPLSTGPWTQRVETAVVSCVTAIRVMFSTQK